MKEGGWTRMLLKNDHYGINMAMTLRAETRLAKKTDEALKYRDNL